MSVPVFALLAVLFFFGSAAVASQQTSTQTIYVNPTATCGTSCDGSLNKPYLTISPAVSKAKRNPTIVLQAGVYKGTGNKNIQVNDRLTISASGNVTIDCEGAGSAFIVSRSTVEFVGMNITNCNNTNGGAVSVSDADATFTSVAFHNNYAANGGALYVQDGSVVLDEVTCSNNEALTGGGCVSVSRARVSISTSSNIRCNKAASHLGEDIFCSKGSLTLPSTVSTWMTEMGISCVSCGVPFGMCGQKQTDECTPIVIPPGEEGICASPSHPYSKNCGDSFCDVSSENCLTCPSDCPSCSFDGVRLDSYACTPTLRANSSSCLVSVTAIVAPSISDFLPEVKCSVSGVMRSYFTVPRTGMYDIRLEGKNVGGIVTINGELVIGSAVEMAELRTTRSVHLDQGKPLSLVVDFFSFTPSTRSISVLYRPQGSGQFVVLDSTFVSKNKCGDGILDEAESNSTSPLYCESDVVVNTPPPPPAPTSEAPVEAPFQPPLNPPVDPPADIPIPPFDYLKNCGDGICDEAVESCLTCPRDCPSCSFDGARLDSYVCSAALRAQNASCLAAIDAVGKLSISEFLPDSNSPVVSGVLTSYFKVAQSGRYDLRLQGTNVGGLVKVNGEVVIRATAPMEELTTTRAVYLEQGKNLRLHIEFSSSSPKTRTLALLIRAQGSEDFSLLNSTFVSINECGDGIVDPAETDPASALYCPFDVNVANKVAPAPAAPVCGDGICNEQYPELCFVDCYNEFAAKKCTRKDLRERVLSQTPVGRDTVGRLLNTQTAFHLPGSEQLQHGIDIFTGESAKKPIFYFRHCGDTDTVEDPWRGWAYSVPEELIAKPSPKCVLDMSTTQIESASKLATSMSESSKSSTEVSAGGSFGSIGGSASVNFANEKSVKAAREMESKQTGSVYMVETECTSSQVVVVKHSFHPQFLGELRTVRNASDIARLLDHYGTHYMTSATLGGRLRQLTSIDSRFQSSKSSSEIQQHAEIGFSASISSPVFSASGSHSESTDSAVTSDEQNSYLESSTRSKLIIYGGTPGAFGPSSSSDTSYGEWAANVDVRPVPIHYSLAPISSIIPRTWAINHTTSIYDLWLEAEQLWIESRQLAEPVPLQHTQYTLAWAMRSRPRYPGMDQEREWYNIELTDTDNGRKFNLVLQQDAKPVSIYSNVHRILFWSFSAPYMKRYTFSIHDGVSGSSPHDTAGTVVAGLAQHLSTSFVTTNNKVLDPLRYHVVLELVTESFSQVANCRINRALLTLVIKGTTGQATRTVPFQAPDDLQNSNVGKVQIQEYTVSSQNYTIGRLTKLELQGVEHRNWYDQADIPACPVRWEVTRGFVAAPDCESPPCPHRMYALTYGSGDSRVLGSTNPNEKAIATLKLTETMATNSSIRMITTGLFVGILARRSGVHNP